ncbi:MAG: SUMF1/EgtB/PvdO family nonheme iron enzyme [Proteobacteria bacterium]|nr:SUMF1/EgtB/PvdO family nonheme iron enzyme [Pseudomonadota bacterium]
MIFPSKPSTLHSLLFCGLLIVLLSCGSPDVGYLTFHLVWPPEARMLESEKAGKLGSPDAGTTEDFISQLETRNPKLETGYQPQADYTGVTLIRASLWTGTTKVTEAEHSFSLHHGEMSAPPGTYLLRIEGLDSSSAVIFRGESSSVTIKKGKTSDAGEIVMEPVTSSNLPTALSDLTANPISSSQISLQWQDNSDNEEGFKIERKTGSGGSYIQIAVVNSNVNTYQDYALTCETEYYYQVRATNSDGDSDYSNEVPATTLDCPSTTPAAPSNLAAGVVSSSQIDLSWSDNSDNEDGFAIERKTGAGGTYAQIGTVNAGTASCQDPGLVCNMEYYYRVTAYNGMGSSVYSSEANATTSACPLSAPTAPSGLTATAVSATQINLSWADNSSNEDGFKIERKTGVAGTYSQITSVGIGVTNYQDSGLICETTYFYRARAFNSVGDSNYSNEIGMMAGDCPLTVPTAPSNLTSTVISYSRINIYWVDNSNNEERFKIERKTGVGGTYVQIGTVSAGVATYNNTGLTCETNYYYRVRAYNSAGDSSFSVEINSTTSACPLTSPIAPSNLQATAVSSSQIDLAWTDNSNNENGFKIERKTGPGGTYSLIYTTVSNATSYSNTSLSPSTTYYYRVYSYNSAGNSSFSSVVYATTQCMATSETVCIPQGCFNMGDAFNEGDSSERPVHNVCISAFELDIYEVTNARYKQCVDAGECIAPQLISSNTRSSYYGNSTYDNFPMIYVDWFEAKAYCQWAGLRLPTEAEWEYAARGGLEGKRYPWGDNDPTCTLGASNGAQYVPCSPDDTIEVGSFAANGYGLYDMSGNVLEWVNDWYGEGYYSSSPTNDPQGSGSGTARLFRGGNWIDAAYPYSLRVAYRSVNGPGMSDKSLGFRCVR